MVITEILKNTEYTGLLHPDTEIDGIVYDSRKACEGTLFVCLTGEYADGHDYAASAYSNGCRCFLAERELALPGDAVVLICKDTRAALAVISGNFFSHPSREISVIGVTGTKGKTTVTHMLRAVFEECGIKSGVIGTVGAFFGDKRYPTVNTTPESFETQKLLRMMADEGCKAVFIEVSSLGLKAHRVDGIHFSDAIFTNISPDHIGGREHKSFEEYAYWKKTLFSMCDRAFLNVDDAFSQGIIKDIVCPYNTFALYGDADYKADEISCVRSAHAFCTDFTVEFGGEKKACRVSMPGVFSVYNALAAIALCLSKGIGFAEAAGALAKVSVKGRMQSVPLGTDFSVIIDYAHNGVSLKNVLETLREYEHNKIITVFGCVGCRAQIRRREMGLISGRMSDLSVITTDDPEYEDAHAITLEVASFVEQAGGKYVIIDDRAEAIKYAIENAVKGDIVLLAGKGHEEYQKIGAEKLHFSDYEQAIKYMRCTK